MAFPSVFVRQGHAISKSEKKKGEKRRKKKKKKTLHSWLAHNSNILGSARTNSATILQILRETINFFTMLAANCFRARETCFLAGDLYLCCLSLILCWLFVCFVLPLFVSSFVCFFLRVCVCVCVCVCVLYWLLGLVNVWEGVSRGALSLCYVRNCAVQEILIIIRTRWGMNTLRCRNATGAWIGVCETDTGMNTGSVR